MPTQATNNECNSPQGVQRKGPYYEFSVVYTDRALNLMSPPFQKVMRDLSASLKSAYNADSVALIPGSGTFAMEAVALQFGSGKKCLVIRNGYFSFRWSDIFSVTHAPLSEVVLKARPVGDQINNSLPQFAPIPIEEAVASILSERPAVVFAPHVETAVGIILPETYIKALGAAAREVGALFVLDGIAAGTAWCNMKELGVDVYISAPQKGWSAPCCAGVVMMSARARAALASEKPARNSFSCNLAQWTNVMEMYENKSGKGPGFRYYTSIPTDALEAFRNAVQELEDWGLLRAKAAAEQLGLRVRALLAARGFRSTAAEGFQAPGVVVVYSPWKGMVGRFKEQSIQVAGGVPWKLDEEQYGGGGGGGGLNPATGTFRVGLFGLDKLKDVDACVHRFARALDRVCEGLGPQPAATASSSSTATTATTPGVVVPHAGGVPLMSRL